MSPRPAYLPLTIFTPRSSCHCFFTNASTITTAATAAVMAMTESSRKHPLSKRTFISTPRQHNGRPTMENIMRRRARNMPSTKLRMKKDTAAANAPNDIGLLPETFIMPSGKNLPSIFNDPRKRWRLEWKRVKNKLLNYFMLIIYKYGDSLRPRPILELRQRKRIARELYELMNQAMAEKDIATLRSICADGIFESIRTRISWRDPEENLYWSLALPSSSSSSEIINRLLGKPNIKASVVSDRAAPLPFPYSPAKGPSNRVRQIVVRLDSAQKLVRWRWKIDDSSSNDYVAEPTTTYPTNMAQKDNSSTSTSAEDNVKREILAQTSNPKDPYNQQQQQQQQQQQNLLNKVEILSNTGISQPHQITEYLVLQQLLTNGAQEPWSIWGTAEETTIEVLDRWEGGGHVHDDNDDGAGADVAIGGSGHSVNNARFTGSKEDKKKMNA